eukprot:3990474-Pyramimonas_sp.AAC.3
MAAWSPSQAPDPAPEQIGGRVEFSSVVEWLNKGLMAAWSPSDGGGRGYGADAPGPVPGGAL